MKLQHFQPINKCQQESYHCAKSIRIRSYSGPHFSCNFPHSDWIRRDTEHLSVFSPNAGKYGKNVDQSNSEYGLCLIYQINFQTFTRYIYWIKNINRNKQAYHEMSMTEFSNKSWNTTSGLFNEVNWKKNWLSSADTEI